MCGWSLDPHHPHPTACSTYDPADPSRCHNCTTNPDDVAVGSVEVRVTTANSAPSVIDQIANAPIARVAVTDPCNASLRGSPFPHLPHNQSNKPWQLPHTALSGAASVYTTTQGMKRWTARLENYAATVEDVAICSSCVLTSVPTPTINSCMAKKAKRWIPSFTVTARVEVEPTSILRGG